MNPSIAAEEDCGKNASTVDPSRLHFEPNRPVSREFAGTLADSVL